MTPEVNTGFILSSIDLHSAEHMKSLIFLLCYIILFAHKQLGKLSTYLGHSGTLSNITCTMM